MHVARINNNPLVTNNSNSFEENCKICGDHAHGVHFGVMSCRACAAFYRRFIVLNLEYECLRDARKCKIDNSRRNSCRHCRFQKCLKVGMTTDNVQFNRDIYSHSNRKQKKPKSTDSPDENIDYNELVPYERIHSSEINLQNKLYQNTILEECKNIDIRIECEKIFGRDFPNLDHDLGHLNLLQKVAFGLEKMRETQDVIDIKFENRLSFENLVPHWQNVATKMAVLWMHSWAFRNISSAQQLRIFRCMWKTIYRLERLQMTVEVFGEKCIDEKKMIISCKRAIQLDALFIDIDGVSRDKKKTTLQEYKKYASRLIEDVARPLCQLKLHPIEVAWMLCIFCQHNEETFLGDEVVDVTNQFGDELCNNLHAYYKSNSILNYAVRIQKMMKIIVAMKKIHYDDLNGNLDGHIMTGPETGEIREKFLEQLKGYC